LVFWYVRITNTRQSKEAKQVPAMKNFLKRCVSTSRKESAERKNGKRRKLSFVCKSKKKHSEDLKTIKRLQDEENKIKPRRKESYFDIHF